MIWGDLYCWQQDKNAFHPALQMAINYLTEIDYSQVEAGRYPIQGEEIYAIVQNATTAPRNERKSECHRDYVDVQFLIEGLEELYYVARQSPGNVPVLDQLAEKDRLLYDEVENEIELILKPGMFAVFFPNDLHRALCCREKTETIKKAVIKIHKDLFVN